MELLQSCTKPSILSDMIYKSWSSVPYDHRDDSLYHIFMIIVPPITILHWYDPQAPLGDFSLSKV